MVFTPILDLENTKPIFYSEYPTFEGIVTKRPHLA